MKAILIDDEQLALNYLEHQLLDGTDVQIVGKYIDPMVGKQAIMTHEVDLVFLDIQIPGLNGIELAEQLLEAKPGLNIVFVTAYEEYAIQAFELNALDYVLKPVGKERLLKTIERVKSGIKAPSSLASPETGSMRMNLFQEVTISVGEQIIPLRWRTTKVQQLFLYLVQHRGQTVNKTTIIELLWPDLETDKAYQQLYTAIYYIRKTLAPYEQHFELTNTSEGYRLRLKNVALDADLLEQFFRSDIQLSGETIGQYEQVIQLFKGDYLQGCDYVWAESERQRLQLMWTQASLKLVNWYFANGEFDKAMRLCFDIIQRNPLEEEAHFCLMKIFADMGRRSSVHQQYQQLKQVLHKELQDEPMPAITEWYYHWKQSEE